MVAVLFATRDSVYKQIPGCDVYDIDRDARNYLGHAPVVAHPPCRTWGRLRQFVRDAPEDERGLALFAVDRVRELGGVLEHPFASSLWPSAGLPKAGERDSLGGWTLPMPQFWFGHRAEKASLFYIVGCEPENVPPIPFKLGDPSFVVQSRKRQDYRPHIPKRERERTPEDLARWLVELATKCNRR